MVLESCEASVAPAAAVGTVKGVAEVAPASAAVTPGVGWWLSCDCDPAGVAKPAVSMDGLTLPAAVLVPAASVIPACSLI